MTGILYIVSTPIGNLEDITYRAIRILNESDIIAAEDTRHTLKLLNHYNISKPLTSYHEYNKIPKTAQLIQKLKQGESVALLSDAGTPGISDPGFYLIREAIREQISVIPIPGVTALITALSVSGLATDAFYFRGFLPKKTAQRIKIMDTIKELHCTLIFYESPHRIKNTLEDMLKIFGDRNIVLGKELTKKFEEFFRGKLSQIAAQISSKNIKGEWTILLEGKKKE